MSRFTRIETFDVEIGSPLQPLEVTPGADAVPRVLVRIHGIPVGMVDLAGRDVARAPDRYSAVIWERLATRICDHLAEDGLERPERLGAEGLPTGDVPQCRRDLDEFRRRAPFASVVIASRDGAQKLHRTLERVASLDYPAFEVIVVDNAPTSTATFELVAEIAERDGRVRYVREDRPGTSWARNAGAGEAKGDPVAFIDDDVIIEPDWLLHAVRACSLRDDVGCVTGMILAAELETPAQAWIEQFGGYGKGFQRRRYNLRADRPADALFPYAAGQFGSGANMTFRADALRAIGGFDPAIGGGTPAMAGEDIAAFFAVINRGYSLVYEPSAIVRHYHHRRYADLRRQVYAYGVGLSVHITKAIADDPRRLPDIARRVAPGLRYLLSPGSGKNAGKSDTYPPALTRAELRGIMFGPVAYLLGRWNLRRVRMAARTVPPSTR